ncbi:hypothetical protein L3X38_013789 [Prunus dulcis]|uniref:Integrase catalytic domain-containing protein n=1 Tax=Prunus dulcis TaxID=3755 RepID=A0AAD4WP38_PRUDU|nr:hypothetical protein L3X38_013789 [Prunus dulcis]
MVSTQFHALVKVFRTDNGGEYVNNTLTSFFCAQGIIHQTTTPFTPQQNGVSERKNRQLLEVACSLVLDMSVSHHLWGHAVLSAAYLINRTPSLVLDFKTPHDVFGDHVSPISVSKLPPKVFGCVAYVHVYFHQRSKLDPCALRCVFIGYSSTQKGYKCYHPHTQKGKRGSELESLGLDNDVFEDTAPRKETTCRTEASNRSPISEDETCGPCEETTDRLLELYQSPISGDEAGALGVKTTSHTEASDQSPVSKNNDSDSCMDEFDAIPPSTLPEPQSTRDSESSEPARFCFWELTKQLPRVVTHPGIAPASNSLNFGVPTNPKPVSSQKASYRFRVAQRTGPNSTYYDIVRSGTHDWALTGLFLGRTTFSCAPKRPRAMRMRGVPYKAHHPLSVWSMWGPRAMRMRGVPYKAHHPLSVWSMWDLTIHPP